MLLVYVGVYVFVCLYITALLFSMLEKDDFRTSWVFSTPLAVHS